MQPDVLDKKPGSPRAKPQPCSERAGQCVYLFGAHPAADPRALDKTVTGGKGANLAEMANIGLRVPPGFTITTDECLRYLRDKRFSNTMREQSELALKEVEQLAGKRFGDPADPLLVSVRSGARISMPGMMDTVLNLGLNDQTVEGLAQSAGDERFAWDSYRRFIQMYSDVVLGLGHQLFEDSLETLKRDKGYGSDHEMRASDWKELVAEYKEIVEIEHGCPFPQNSRQQLWSAIGAIFDSWDCERAKTYRRLNDIPADWGTAVNVQSMVFGNMGNNSATGVAFTRDPATGAKAYYGEWLPNAQGEDVVAGIRTPQHLTRHAREKAAASLPSMEESMPKVYRELVRIFDLLEQHYHEMQDVEFTIERGRLWMLQTRTGKRTAAAALKIATDMVEEGLIDRKTAVLRVDAASLDQLLHPSLDSDAGREILATGLAASPGAACGKIVLDADTAEAWAARGEKVILVRTETSPEDIHGMHAASGILTARGGMTSHAAVVARGMGRPCVAATLTLSIDLPGRRLALGGRHFAEGDVITVDGTRGEIMAGEMPMIEPELGADYATLMKWADEYRRMHIRANAETPSDCRRAVQFGAEGIGLCRTEHMFFDEKRISAVREMIIAEDPAGRRSALRKLLREQRRDFIEIFEAMADLPVTIRLLDPPLHEFLPTHEQEFERLAEETGICARELKLRTARLHESNPMLGHRGCRLGITCPEIYEMQVRAIFEAACHVQSNGRPYGALEIMVPLVASRRELQIVRALIDGVAAQVFKECGQTVDYLTGTMIELPRAALLAHEIAEDAQFFSFGTNDLTQTALGLSRDDAASFLPAYIEKGVYASDPFVSLDVDGAGELMSIAAKRGRRTRPDIKLGVCGEHGGNPASIAFFEQLGLDYVSASPFRVPAARLAAAQASLLAPAAFGT